MASIDSFSNSGKTRTFKPRKDAPEGTKQYQLRRYAEATLVRIFKVFVELYFTPYVGLRESTTSCPVTGGRGLGRMARSA